ncbi:hypothetical protein [Methylobacterium sp. J-070]|uniref:hypothetical protein n=1 Tax=Methylobacterium sp. J-070 TaxID=2836650 RepID=UPI001FB9EFD6|nr:hypothetical protein [Methylobacterium sp. J-070]MCJ2054051.1 hypothetical protein [Methylobacterium sp. J-070]
MQQLAQAQGQGGMGQHVPQATPPGFTGYQPQTPPTGTPTPVVQPQAQSLASAAMSALGPNSAEAATPDPNDIRGRFISTLQQGGLTNPNGLGAVAAYAQHESRYSPSNITGSWSDPSESGQAGTSGGILSWRADRLDNMRAATAGAADPVAAQAKFLLQENPQLTQGLQSAGSPEEAHRLMADAWKFAGYNRPGGENAARLATTRAYANSFANGQALPSPGSSSVSPGIARPAGTSMGSTAQAGGFGLAGVQGLGSAVPGQSSPTPDVASLSGQPLTMDGPPAQPQSNSYGNIANALGALKQQQQQQKPPQQMKLAQPYRPQPIGLQQAQQMFDPGNSTAPCAMPGCEAFDTQKLYIQVSERNRKDLS